MLCYLLPFKMPHQPSLLPRILFICLVGILS